MPKGIHRKEINKRIKFIKRELQERVKKIQSSELDTKEDIKNALTLLTAEVKYSASLKIPFIDYLPSSHRYKNATPTGYMKLLKSLKIKLQEKISQGHIDPVYLKDSYSAQGSTSSAVTDTLSELSEDDSQEKNDSKQKNSITDPLKASIDVDSKQVSEDSQVKSALPQAEPIDLNPKPQVPQISLPQDILAPPAPVKKAVAKKYLHEFPLFEGSQLIEWNQDGRTNQFNRLVIAILRGFNNDGKIPYGNIDDVISNINQIWGLAQLPLPSSKADEQFFSFYWPLFKEALTQSAVESTPFSKAALDWSFSEERSVLEHFKETLQPGPKSLAESKDRSQVSSKKISRIRNGELERVTDAFDIYKQSIKTNEEKKKRTHEAVHHHLNTENATILVDRLFVGSGFAGTLLMTTDPSLPTVARKAFVQLEEYLLAKDKPEVLQLETLLLSEQETGTWTKSEHRSEQEHPLLEIAGNVNAGDFIPTKQSIERAKRTNTRHLFYAATVNMAKKDTPPPLYQVKVEKIEKQANHSTDWQIPSCNFRLQVSIKANDSTLSTTIYAKNIDFALGMGVGQTGGFEEALQNDFEGTCTASDNIPKDMGKTLLAKYSTYNSEKGFTPIIHGNEYDLSDRERQALQEVKTRRVVVIGGAGGASTAYRIAVLGTDKMGVRLQNSDGSFLQDKKGISLNHNVKIFARGRVSYNNLAVQATESFEYAKANKSLFESYALQGIRMEGEEIVLRFHNKTGASEISAEKARMLKISNEEKVVEDNGKFYLLNLHEERCDQLIAGMGQDASLIRKLILAEIKQDDLEIMRGFDGHYLGLSTKCGTVRLHGAMAGNISRDFTKDLEFSLSRSNLPKNGNDQNIMPCVIPKLFSFFSSSDAKPRRVCINVNTCFLQRGDFRNHPTEFSMILERSGLKPVEIEAFTQFLKEKRATDPTGAGVSNKDLLLYINKSGLSDRIQVISSCSIMSKKDFDICNSYAF